MSNSWLFFYRFPSYSFYFCAWYNLHIIKHTDFKCSAQSILAILYVNNHHSKQERIFPSSQKTLSCSFPVSLHPHCPRGNNYEVFLNYRFVLLFLKFHRSRIRQYAHVYVRLVLLSIMFLKFIQVVCTNSLFLFTAAQYSKIRIFHGLFSQSSINGHLGGFQFGTTMTQAVMNIIMQIFVWIYFFPLSWVELLVWRSGVCFIL